MNRITIEKAANGYIVTQSSNRLSECAGLTYPTDDPHVFETFDNMTAWLRDRWDPLGPQAISD